MPDVNDRDDSDLWILPLHGIEAPVTLFPLRAAVTDADAAAADHFYDDDELPTIEFRPRLRRSA